MKVSVIIPAYNKGELTVRAIESAMRQTHKDIEIVVVDDGGTDCLEDRLYPHRFTTKNLTYLWHPNRGCSASRNRGIVESSGDYLAFLDCDDYYMPDKIKAGIGYDFSFTDAYRNGKVYKPKIGNLLFGNYICNSTVMIKRECLNKVGLFDEEMFIAADWDMWLRLEEHYKPHYIERPLTCYHE